jgi:rod shape-determining protein MreB
MGLLNFLKDTIGIDPGSQYLRIIKDGELVFNELSQISIDKVNNVVSGVGNSTRVTKKDTLVKPVSYVIADFHAFEMLLRGALKKLLNSNSFFPKSYIMYFSVPTGLSEIEKRAYRDSGEHANAVEVHMVHQSCCSAVGLNILFEKKHFILIDFSSSKIEIVVFANSLIVADGVIRFGTLKIFKLLKNYIRRKYKIELGDKEVEGILTSISTNENDDELTIKYTTFKTKEIIDLLSNLFNLVNDEFLETIERASNHPDIEKVIINGAYFTGGGSSNRYLREQIKLDERMKRSFSQNPLMDNVNGLKQIIASREKFKNYIMY